MNPEKTDKIEAFKSNITPEYSEMLSHIDNQWKKAWPSLEEEAKDRGMDLNVEMCMNHLSGKSFMSGFAGRFT
jgi:hypothetical protein